MSIRHIEGYRQIYPQKRHDYDWSPVWDTVGLFVAYAAFVFGVMTIIL